MHLKNVCENLNREEAFEVVSMGAYDKEEAYREKSKTYYIGSGILGDPEDESR
jgi:hypothetical protein